ncbi:hypothetical protein IMSAGC006_00871 [Muribaculaceae bacterium]|nr:hypothetical protein IMSAGC006_00871 [Muribaculaceae bacterium]
MGKFNRISLIMNNDINESTKCYTWRKKHPLFCLIAVRG